MTIPTYKSSERIGHDKRKWKTHLDQIDDFFLPTQADIDTAKRKGARVQKCTSKETNAKKPESDATEEPLDERDDSDNEFEPVVAAEPLPGERERAAVQDKNLSMQEEALPQLHASFEHVIEEVRQLLTSMRPDDERCASVMSTLYTCRARLASPPGHAACVKENQCKQDVMCPKEEAHQQQENLDDNTKTCPMEGVRCPTQRQAGARPFFAILSFFGSVQGATFSSLVLCVLVCAWVCDSIWREQQGAATVHTCP